MPMSPFFATRKAAEPVESLIRRLLETLRPEGDVEWIADRIHRGEEAMWITMGEVEPCEKTLDIDAVLNSRLAHEH